MYLATVVEYPIHERDDRSFEVDILETKATIRPLPPLFPRKGVREVGASAVDANTLPVVMLERMLVRVAQRDKPTAVGRVIAIVLVDLSVRKARGAGHRAPNDIVRSRRTLTFMAVLVFVRMDVLVVNANVVALDLVKEPILPTELGDILEEHLEDATLAVKDKMAQRLNGGGLGRVFDGFHKGYYSAFITARRLFRSNLR